MLVFCQLEQAAKEDKPNDDSILPKQIFLIVYVSTLVISLFDKN